MIRVVARCAVRSLINRWSFNHHVSMATAFGPLRSCSEFDVFFWRKRMVVMMMNTNLSLLEKAMASTEEDRRERSVTKEEAKKGESSITISRWKVTIEDGTDWPWNCFMPWETYRADLSINLSKHHMPKTFIDKFAYRTVKLLRISTDLFFKRWYGCRAMMRETVAAILGIIEGVLLHLRSLRKFQQSGGWIKALLEEVENERMHLMTMVELVQPKRKNILCQKTSYGHEFELAQVTNQPLPNDDDDAFD